MAASDLSQAKLMARIRQLDPVLATQLSSKMLLGAEVAALEELVNHLEICSQKSALAVHAMERQAAEYESESIRVQEQMALVGIYPGLLSSSGKETLDELAAVSAELQLATPSSLAALTAWSQLCMDSMKASRLKTRAVHQNAGLVRTCDSLDVRMGGLKKSLQAAATEQYTKEKEMAVQRVTITDFTTKVKNYKHQQAKLHEGLVKNGLRPELAHHVLVAKHSEMETKQAQLAEVQQQLDGFHSMPASLVAAELQLKQLREGLMSVQNKLDRGLANLS
eukprot:gene9779-7661_t